MYAYECDLSSDETNSVVEVCVCVCVRVCVGGVVVLEKSLSLAMLHVCVCVCMRVYVRVFCCHFTWSLRYMRLHYHCRTVLNDWPCVYVCVCEKDRERERVRCERVIQA